MLTLSKFMSRSYNIRNRPGVPRSLIKIVDFFTKDDGNLIVFRVGSESDPKISYDSRIHIVGNTLTPMTPIKFRCTCPSFKFQFETVLAKHDALIGKPDNIRLPKTQIIHVCKHLEGCLNFLMTFKNLGYIATRIKHQSGV